MNCSPRCLKMQLHLSPPCLQPKVMFLDEIRQWKKNLEEIKYLALKNVERYYYSGIPCFFRRDLTQYRMDHFTHYVGRMIFDFLTDASLRINVTYINFDITLMKRECSKKYSNCREEIIVAVIFINFPEVQQLKVNLSYISMKSKLAHRSPRQKYTPF